MSTEETKALCHPTRAGILKYLRMAPMRRSALTEAIGVPTAEVRYHCDVLCCCGCIKDAGTSGPDSDDPLFETA